MTITTTTVRSGPYTPDGVTTTFPFAFLALSPSELEVTQVQTDGSEAAITGWTPTLNGEGGSVTFGTAPTIGSGDIYVNAAPDFKQLVTPNASILPGTIAGSFDRLTQMILVVYARGGVGGGGGLPDLGAINAAVAAAVAPAVTAALAASGALLSDQGTGS